MELISVRQLNHLNDDVSYQTPRDYLGLSQIGNTCHRALQHYHYWTYESPITNRLQRLFNAGHSAEDLFISDLNSIGIEVDGRQEEIVGYAGHWKGHTDGKIKNSEPILAEFKTHNDKNFKDVHKKGVKKSKPGHYSQMQAYMGYLGYEKGLYMAINKNDSTYYSELIDFDEEHFKDLQAKEKEVVHAETLLPRIGNNSRAWFECKFCDASKVCFGDDSVVKTCRSCRYVDVVHNGEWICSYDGGDHEGMVLTSAEQKAACDNYELHEMFDD